MYGKNNSSRYSRSIVMVEHTQSNYNNRSNNSSSSSSSSSSDGLSSGLLGLVSLAQTDSTLVPPLRNQDDNTEL